MSYFKTLVLHGDQYNKYIKNSRDSTITDIHPAASKVSLFCEWNYSHLQWKSEGESGQLEQQPGPVYLEAAVIHSVTKVTQVTACLAEVWGQAHATLEPPPRSPAQETWGHQPANLPVLASQGEWASTHSKHDPECHKHANSVCFTQNSSSKLHQKITELIRLEKISEIVESNLSLDTTCQPDPGTESHVLKHLQVTTPPPWALRSTT